MFLFATGYIIIGILLVIGSVGVARYRRSHRKLHPEVRRCKCGYALTGLSIPRCPECGRAIGFDRTFEDLGISEEEVRQNVARKQAEAQRRNAEPDKPRDAEP
jgi:hypothetical protein